MSADITLKWSPDEPPIKGILDHTQNLLTGARALLDSGLSHLAYHLALAAVEEIGKLEVVLIDRAVPREEGDLPLQKRVMEDHVGKIFWAFWGTSFGRQIICDKQIQWHQNMARDLHDKRKRALYTDPAAEPFRPPAEEVSPAEARRLIEFGELRLDMQRRRKPTTLSDQEAEDLAWFVAASKDARKALFIMSPQSMQKMVELGDVNAWARWLHEADVKLDDQLTAIAEAEANRQPAEGDSDSPKWKFRIRLKTNSHILKPKAISAWNRLTGPIKWTFVDKRAKDELLVEFELSRSVLASQLYDVGLQFSYRFVVALNIASQGFFWFDVPLQTESFAESVEDLETGALMHIGRVPIGHVERNITALNESQVMRAGLVFGLLPHEGVALNSYRQYLGGMLWLAKTDIHSQFQAQAFRAFASALQAAMQAYGDWDGASPFPAAANAFFEPHVTGAGGFIAEVDQLLTQFSTDQTKPDVNIDQAAKMKLVVDYYFVLALEREARRRADSDVESNSVT